MDEAPGEVTRLLLEWRAGNEAALEAVTPFIYSELKTMAASYMRRERDGHTLQPTALVHEAYLRLAGKGGPAWEDRTHFYSIAARLMRQILVDHARKHLTGKRGQGLRAVTLNEAVLLGPYNAEQFIGISTALDRLAKLDERKARAIELRFFGGLTVEEIAAILKISVMTVNRDLRFAESWLFSELGGKQP